MIEPLLYVMFVLSTSIALSKHVGHEELELARLLTRGGRREWLNTRSAKMSRWRSTMVRARAQRTFAFASGYISFLLEDPCSYDRSLVGDLEELVLGIYGEPDA